MPTDTESNTASILQPDAAATLMRRATYASVAVAIILFASKLIAWQLSGSVSLLASLVDSALDGLASLLNLLAVRQALIPADKEHRFGHGKAEALAGLGQAAFIAVSSVFLLVQAVERLQQPQEISAAGIGVAVMVLSIVLTMVLIAYQRYVIRYTDSTAIKADELHYRTDLLVNSSVLLALLLSVWGWAGFDAVFAIAISFYIAYSAWSIVKQAFDHLMDRELPDDDREKIMQTVLAHPEVKGMHDLRTRSAGISTFIQLHMELDDNLRLLNAHRISEEVEASLMAVWPGAEIIIHFDPVSIVERPTDSSERTL